MTSPLKHLIEQTRLDLKEPFVHIVGKWVLGFGIVFILIGFLLAWFLGWSNG